MKIEILHVRDSDGGCDHTVVVDGVVLDPTTVHVVDVDPGRGYDRATWDEIVEGHQRDADHTPAFRAAVLEAFELASDNSHIVERW